MNETTVIKRLLNVHFFYLDPGVKTYQNQSTNHILITSIFRQNFRSPLLFESHEKVKTTVYEFVTSLVLGKVRRFMMTGRNSNVEKVILSNEI